MSGWRKTRRDAAHGDDAARLGGREVVLATARAGERAEQLVERAAVERRRQRRAPGGCASGSSATRAAEELLDPRRRSAAAS